MAIDPATLSIVLPKILQTIGTLGGKTSKQGSAMGGIEATKGLSGILGLVQGLQSRKLEREAESLGPPLKDPGQVEDLLRARARLRGLETGAAASPFIDRIMEGASETTRSALKAAEGGAGLSAALRAQMQRDRSIAQTGAQFAQQIPQQQTIVNQLQSEIARRAADIQMADKLRKQALATARRKEASQNLGNLLARGEGFGGLNLGGGGFGRTGSTGAGFEAPDFLAGGIAGMQRRASGIDQDILFPGGIGKFF